MADDKDKQPGNEAVEGEGSYSATRRYDEATEKFVRSGKVEPAAKEAERAIEGREKPELEKAEREGKKHIAEDEPE